MKARDVVAGWPRGTSTTKPYPPETPMWRLWTDWGEVADRLIEWEDNRKYHEEQDRMMHKFRTQTGRFLPWEKKYPGRVPFKLVGFTE